MTANKHQKGETAYLCCVFAPVLLIAAISLVMAIVMYFAAPPARAAAPANVKQPAYAPWMGCPAAAKFGKVFTCRLYVRNNLDVPLQIQGCLDYRSYGGPGKGATLAIGCWASVKQSNIPFGNFRDTLRWGGKPWEFTLGPHKVKPYFFKLKMGDREPCVAASFFAPRINDARATKLKCMGITVTGTA